MEELPSDNAFVQVVKFLYCFNLMFSYPLCIYPTNMIIDASLFKSVTPNSTKRLVYENISHTIVLIIAIILALWLYEYLDKVLAIIGTVCGLSVVLVIPSICHYKLIATDKVDGS